MKLVILSRDLMLSSRVEGVAIRLGHTVATIADPSVAIENIGSEEGVLLLVDLQLLGLEITDLVDRVRQTSSNVKIIACGPHVHENRLNAAREAGCDMVVTRGQLDREADAILAS